MSATPPVIPWKTIEVSPFICESCGRTSQALPLDAGNDLFELFLWLCGLIPGLIYHLWRNNRRTIGCSFCGRPVVDCGSPRGYLLLKQFYGDNQFVITPPPARAVASGWGWPLFFFFITALVIAILVVIISMQTLP